MKFTRKQYVRALKVVISVAFFIVLFSFVQGKELLAMYRRIDWLYFTLSFALIPVMLSASCLKWKVILGDKGRHISFIQLLRIYAVGYFFSNLLPSTVGGDVVRSYYSGRLLDNQALAAVSIFVERFTGILLLFFLVAFAPLLAPELYRTPYILVPAGAGLVLLAITWCLLQPRSSNCNACRGRTETCSGLRAISLASLTMARPCKSVWGNSRMKRCNT